MEPLSPFRYRKEATTWLIIDSLSTESQQPDTYRRWSPMQTAFTFQRHAMHDWATVQLCTTWSYFFYTTIKVFWPNTRMFCICLQGVVVQASLASSHDTGNSIFTSHVIIMDELDHHPDANNTMKTGKLMSDDIMGTDVSSLDHHMMIALSSGPQSHPLNLTHTTTMSPMSLTTVSHTTTSHASDSHLTVFFHATTTTWTHPAGSTSIPVPNPTHLTPHSTSLTPTVLLPSLTQVSDKLLMVPHNHTVCPANFTPASVAFTPASTHQHPLSVPVNVTVATLQLGTCPITRILAAAMIPRKAVAHPTGGPFQPKLMVAFTPMVLPLAATPSGVQFSLLGPHLTGLAHRGTTLTTGNQSVAHTSKPSAAVTPIVLPLPASPPDAKSAVVVPHLVPSAAVGFTSINSNESVVFGSKQAAVVTPMLLLITLAATPFGPEFPLLVPHLLQLATRGSTSINSNQSVSFVSKSSVLASSVQLSASERIVAARSATDYLPWSPQLAPLATRGTTSINISESVLVEYLPQQQQGLFGRGVPLPSVQQDLTGSLAAAAAPAEAAAPAALESCSIIMQLLDATNASMDVTSSSYHAVAHSVKLDEAVAADPGPWGGDVTGAAVSDDSEDADGASDRAIADGIAAPTANASAATVANATASVQATAVAADDVSKEAVISDALSAKPHFASPTFLVSLAFLRYLTN